MRYTNYFDILDINGDVMRFDKHGLVLIKTVAFKRKQNSIYIYTFNQLMEELPEYLINTSRYDYIIPTFSVITQIWHRHGGPYLCISKSQFDTQFMHRWIT